MKAEVQIFPINYLPLAEPHDMKCCVVQLLIVGLILYVFTASSERHSKSADASNCLELNEFISCFELVNVHVEDYSNVSAWAKHIRSESSNIDFSVRVEFHAFDTTFRVHLYQSFAGETTILHQHVPITTISSKGKKTVYRNDLKITFLQGYLLDKPMSSFVYGTIQGGQYNFVIKSQNENYYVEPSRKYLNLNLKSDNASVVYRSSDIRQFSRESELDNCFKIPQAEAVVNESHFKTKVYRSHYKRHRTKRLLKNPLRTCDLCIVVDHTYFQSVGERSVETTISEVVQAVQEADYVFRLTDFDNDTQGDNIGFAISDVRIYETVDASGYLLRDTRLDSTSVLVAFSKYNFDDYCLGMLFTFRDFSRGVIGLAWTSGSGDSTITGGICHRRMHLSPGIDISRDFYNFNTLLVSQLSNGQILHRKTIAATVTHELGHAFGAVHDDTNNVCGSKQTETFGNFIMFSKAPKPDYMLLNNYRFSDCSRTSITATLNRWRGCLNTFPFPVCGNMILEVGEECDCGSEGQCLAADPCCKPPSLLKGNGTSGCKYFRERGSVCSPQTDLCCNSACQIIPSSEAVVCRAATDCMEESVCNGMSSSCPIPKPRRLYSTCANGLGYCSADGVCSESICVMNGLVECQCTFTFTALCKLCCGCDIGSTICLPAEWLGLFQFNASIFNTLISGDQSLYLLPGSKCNRNVGTCNANNICIKNN